MHGIEDLLSDFEFVLCNTDTADPLPVFRRFSLVVLLKPVVEMIMSVAMETIIYEGYILTPPSLKMSVIVISAPQKSLSNCIFKNVWKKLDFKEMSCRLLLTHKVKFHRCQSIRWVFFLKRQSSSASILLGHWGTRRDVSLSPAGYLFKQSSLLLISPYLFSPCYIISFFLSLSLSLH